MLDWCSCPTDCWVFMSLRLWNRCFWLNSFLYDCGSGTLELISVVRGKVRFFIGNTSSFAVVFNLLEKFFFFGILFWHCLLFHLFDWDILIFFIMIFVFIWFIVDGLVWVPFFSFHKVIVNIHNLWLLVFIIWIRVVYYIYQNGTLIFMLFNKHRKFSIELRVGSTYFGKRICKLSYSLHISFL